LVLKNSFSRSTKNLAASCLLTVAAWHGALAEVHGRKKLYFDPLNPSAESDIQPAMHFNPCNIPNRQFSTRQYRNRRMKYRNRANVSRHKLYKGEARLVVGSVGGIDTLCSILYSMQHPIVKRFVRSEIARSHWRSNDPQPAPNGPRPMSIIELPGDSLPLKRLGRFGAGANFCLE
jgi:hypothetical protein